MLSIKLLAALSVLLVTLTAGFYPFFKNLKSDCGHDYPNVESLAAGIFWGVGLMHMLSDASRDFLQMHIDYPLSYMLAGACFLFFLLFEHVGKAVYDKKGSTSTTFAIIAALMLSIHSFFTGAALGLSNSLSIVLVLLFAIFAHKWAVSFALAVKITKSNMSLAKGLSIFGVFALMVPLGILCGEVTNVWLAPHPLIQPIFRSIAAGTFIYLGTLHGLDQAAMIKQCCDLKRFYFVVLGFAIMAVVAIWV